MECKKIIKMLSMFCVALLTLSACEGEDALVSSELLMIDENEMVSSEVGIGSLVKKVKADAAVYYPITAGLSSSTSGVILTEVKVDSLDYVHKGDLLAEVRAYTAEEIAEKESLISTKESELNSKLNAYDSESSRINSLIASCSDNIQKQIYEEQLVQNNLNRDYAYNMDVKEIETLKKELETIKSVSGDCNIYAPFDGIVENVLINSEGTALSSSNVVLNMYSVDTVIVYFDDPGDVYYNTDVTVYAGTGDNKQTISEVIVGADHYLSSQIKQGKAYVRLTGEYDKENLESVSVELETLKAENVLISKSSGISTIKDRDYVYIMKDGKLKRRHVVCGGSDGENTWFLQGVDEGDIIYLQ